MTENIKPSPWGKPFTRNQKDVRGWAVYQLLIFFWIFDFLHLHRLRDPTQYLIRRNQGCSGKNAWLGVKEMTFSSLVSKKVGMEDGRKKKLCWSCWLLSKAGMMVEREGFGMMQLNLQSRPPTAKKRQFTHPSKKRRIPDIRIIEVEVLENFWRIDCERSESVKANSPHLRLSRAKNPLSGAGFQSIFTSTVLLLVSHVRVSPLFRLLLPRFIFPFLVIGEFVFIKGQGIVF